MVTTSPQNKEAIQLQEKLHNAFQGSIKPVPVTAGYFFGLIVAAATMVLLLIMYLGMVAALAYGTYSLIMNPVMVGQVFMSSRGSRMGMFTVVVYVGAIAAGGILFMFMLKPLLSGRAPTATPRKLNKLAEPLLFGFVEKVCKTVGAPMPAEIQVNCEINASAGFRRGAWSMFSNDLLLTIGLPLAGGLTTREFAGVLAHEFGHFSQPVGMRLTYFIRFMNNWFARLVYERDRFDYIVEMWMRDSDTPAITLVALFIRVFVWITRRILWCLMMGGHTVSCYMLRQMEYDADRFEAAMVGADAFEETVRKIAVLNVANTMALDSLTAAWDEGRLADDLPALVNSNVKKIPKQTHEMLMQRLWSMETGTFDTHPSDKDRLRAVRQQKGTPVFLVALPATVLFRDYKQMCKTCSFDFYKIVLGSEVKPQNIRPVDELIANIDAEEDGDKRMCRYLQSPILYARPLPFKETLLSGPSDTSAVVENIRTLRAKMCDAALDYRRALKKYDQADSKVLGSTLARLLINLNCSIDAKQFELAAPTAKAADDAKFRAREEMNKLAQTLVPFEEFAAKRIDSALRLLYAPELAGKLPDVEKLRLEAQDMLPLAEFFGRMIPDLLTLRDEFQVMVILFANLEGREKDEVFCNRIQFTCHELFGKLTDLYEKMGDVVYPFNHVDGLITMREFTMKRIPSAQSPAELHQATAEILDKVFGTYFRLIRRLTALAEKSETAMGLVVLPDLPEDDEAELKRRFREKHAAKVAVKESVASVAVPGPATSPAPCEGRERKSTRGHFEFES